MAGPFEVGWAKSVMTTMLVAPPPEAGYMVRAGQKLRLIAFYDSTHTWRKVMGIMLAALVPD